MKIIAKTKVVAYNQQEHVMNEKRLLAESASARVWRLTFGLERSTLGVNLGLGEHVKVVNHVALADLALQATRQR